jgi:DNA-binding IclR family transcriptional regulator
MQNPPRGRKRGERNPVAKALRAIDWLIQEPGPAVGVRHMASALKLPPSNLHRLLSTLVENGFVHQDEHTARYSLGPELLRWAQLITARAPLREIALHQMRALVAVCNETVFLGLYDEVRQEMMFTANVESEHPLRYVIDLNQWIPMNTGASSLAILAFLPPEQRDPIVERRLRFETPSQGAVANRARLHVELGAIRRRGYAFSRSKRVSGAIGIAAPIFGTGGKVIGDLIITVPEQRFERKDTEKLARLVMKHAAAVTADIGGSRPEESDAKTNAR